MRYLLDTYVLLWALGRPDLLTEQTRTLIEDQANGLAFSSASICETAIKRGLDRPGFRTDAGTVRRKLLRLGYADLSITSTHAVAVVSLPPIHKDPFDRLLIARATVEGVTLLTADATILRYPGPIRRV